MTRGDKVQLNDYNLMAAIDYTSAASIALVVRRGSHLYVMRADVTIPRSQPLMSGEAVYVSAYPYYEETDKHQDLAVAYNLALCEAVNMAIGESDDAS